MKMNCQWNKRTISTTSTSASMRRLYNDFFRSFFIWIELSSSWATVKSRILQWRHVRCWRRRNGKSISRPPSCTIHQTSINPDICTSTVWKMRNVFYHISNPFQKISTESRWALSSILLLRKGFMPYLLTGFRERADAFRHNESHLVGCCGLNSVNKDAPRSILLHWLTPTVGPAKDHCVGLQAAESSRLNPLNCALQKFN